MEKFYNILSHKTETNSHSYFISLDNNHTLFKGHFPEFPVVPGALLVQMIRDLTESALNKKLRLTEATNVKFLKMLLPFEGTNVEVTIDISEGENVKVKGTFKSGEIIYCKLSLIYTIDKN